MNFVALENTTKSLCGTCASFWLKRKQESHLQGANAVLYITVNPCDKGIRRPQILQKP